MGTILVGKAKPVDDIVMRRGKIRHIKDIAQNEITRHFLRHGDRAVACHGEMHGHWCQRRANLDRHTMVLDQKPDLLAQVIGEKIGARDGGGIAARIGHMAKAQAAIGQGVAHRGDTQLGVKGAKPRLVRGAIAQRRAELVAQELHRLRIKRLKMGNGVIGVFKQLALFFLIGADDTGRFVFHVMIFMYKGRAWARRAVTAFPPRPDRSGQNGSHRPAPNRKSAKRG